MQMTGKVVLITGASRGIGEATARIFAAAGAKVGLMARSADQIARIAADCTASHGAEMLAIPGDVSRYADVEAAVGQTRARFDGLDVLIGNAGAIDPIAPLAEADPEAWGRAIDINLKGVFNGMRAVLPGMIAQGSGTILTLSSGAAHNPYEAWSAYCAAKAGAHMLTRAADKEARGQGLRVMGLSPGTVATDMQSKIRASGINPVSQIDWASHVPPDWPARALLWMCGPDADAYLGQDVSLRDEAIRQRVGLI